MTKMDIFFQNNFTLRSSSQTQSPKSLRTTKKKNVSVLQ